jgi:pimeloyl-ACP methyl ester carboxylesterase
MVDISVSPSTESLTASPASTSTAILVLASSPDSPTMAATEAVVLLGRSWGFRLDAIKPVVVLWQGEDDVLVPPAMGRHLATQIPNCHATFFPGAGHLLIDHMPEIIKAFTRSAT